MNQNLKHSSEIAKTEYALEVYNDKGFVRQIDVCSTLKEAQEALAQCTEPLENDEYLDITNIYYDENENEIGID